MAIVHVKEAGQLLDWLASIDLVRHCHMAYGQLDLAARSRYND